LKPPGLRARLALLGLLGVALLVRVAYILDYRPSVLFDHPAGPDVMEYHEWALEILSGKWIWDSVPFHAPLYPYLLAALLWLGAGKMLIARCQGLSALVGMAAMGRAVGNRFGATPMLAMAAIWALYLPLAYYETEFFAEGLAALLHALVLAIWMGGRDRCGIWRCAAMGLLLGLSIITHPTSLLFAAFMAVWVGIERLAIEVERLRTPSQPQGPEPHPLRVIGPPLVLAALVAAIVAPVSVYNSRLAGEPLLVQTHQGLNFYIGNGPGADGTAHVRPGPEWDRLLALPTIKDGILTTAGREASYKRHTWEHIHADRGAWLALLGRKLLLAVHGREVIASAPVEALTPDVVMARAVGWPWFGVAGALAMVGIVATMAGWWMPVVADPLVERTPARWRWLVRLRPILPLVALIGAYIASQVVFVASGRYRVPMMPAVFALAGIGVATLIVQARMGRRGPLVASIVVALATLGVSLLPVVPDSIHKRAEGHMVRANAYKLAGDEASMLRELESAVAAWPEYAAAWTMLGQELDARAADPDRIKECFLNAVRADPESAHAHRQLGLYFQRAGVPSWAADALDRAAALSPEDLGLRVELGKALIAAERPVPAAAHLRHAIDRWPDKYTPIAGPLLAEALVHSAKHADAARVLEAVVEQSPEDVASWLRLAETRLEHDPDPRGAVDAARQAVARTDAADPAALLLLVQAQARAGRHDGVRFTVDKASQAARARNDTAALHRIESWFERYLSERRSVP